MASGELKDAWDLSLLRYSRVEEDCRVLSRALQITPDVDIVLSITRCYYSVLYCQLGVYSMLTICTCVLGVEVGLSGRD